MRTFLQRYDLETIQDLKVRYATKAAAYYREKLQSQANNAQIKYLAPSFDDGRVLLDGRRLDYDNNVLEFLPTEENISDIQSVMEADNILAPDSSRGDLHEVDLLINLDNGEEESKVPQAVIKKEEE